MVVSVIWVTRRKNMTSLIRYLLFYRAMLRIARHSHSFVADSRRPSRPIYLPLYNVDGL